MMMSPGRSDPAKLFGLQKKRRQQEEPIGIPWSKYLCRCEIKNRDFSLAPFPQISQSPQESAEGCSSSSSSSNFKGNSAIEDCPVTPSSGWGDIQSCSTDEQVGSSDDPHMNCQDELSEDFATPKDFSSLEPIPSFGSWEIQSSSLGEELDCMNSDEECGWPGLEHYSSKALENDELRSLMYKYGGVDWDKEGKALTIDVEFEQYFSMLMM